MKGNRNNMSQLWSFTDKDMCCVCGKQLNTHDRCQHCGIFMGSGHLEDFFVTDDDGQHCESCSNWHKTRTYLRHNRSQGG
jgi:hypothetical protein